MCPRTKERLKTTVGSKIVFMNEDVFLCIDVSVVASDVAVKLWELDFSINGNYLNYVFF